MSKRALLPAGLEPPSVADAGRRVLSLRWPLEPAAEAAAALASLGLGVQEMVNPNQQWLARANSSCWSCVCFKVTVRLTSPKGFCQTTPVKVHECLSSVSDME